MPVIPSLTLPNNGDDAVVDQYNAAFQVLVALLNGGLDDDNLADEAVTLSKLATAVQQALVPAGSLFAYGGSSAPSGFLLCYGQAVSRATYSVLFGIVGTSYGVGDGSTTFNLPDLRGRVPVGADAMGGSAANRTQRSTTVTTTNASPTVTPASMTGLAVGMRIMSANIPAGTTITAIGSTTVTASANATASAAGTAARFSMLANDAEVLGAAGGADVHLLITNEMPAHVHSMGAFSVSTYGGGAIGAWQSSGSLNSGSAGGDDAHNNMQPSQVVNYVIKI